MSDANAIKWTSVPHPHHKIKGQDWFWMLGIISVSIAIASILLGNILFAVLIIISAITLGMYANIPPQSHEYTIDTRGVTVDGKLYSYKSIKSFWIDNNRYGGHALLLDIQKPLEPHLVIKINEDIDSNDIQDFLLDYLPEEELFEPFAQRLAEILGF